MQIIFWSGTKCLWLAQYVYEFLVWHKKIGPARNILGPVKGQAISKQFVLSLTAAGTNFLVCRQFECMIKLSQSFFKQPDCCRINLAMLDIQFFQSNDWLFFNFFLNNWGKSLPTFFSNSMLTNHVNIFHFEKDKRKFLHVSWLNILRIAK